jgi:hypothetical protein
MATLSGLTVFTTGTVIDANQMNANFNTVKTFVENLSAGANFDAGAINTEDIANSAITAGKIATGAVTTNKIASSIALTTPNIGAATGASLNCTNAVIDHPATNVRTTNYTLVLGDDGIIIETNSTSAVIISIPLEATVAFPIGTKITIIRANSGAASVVGVSGVTLNCTPQGTANTGNLRAQWSAATLLKRAANSWILMGDLSS